MTIRLIHGFNVWDGGESTVGTLQPYLPTPPPSVLHDYGWTFLLRLRSVNDETVDEILGVAEAGDILVMHSNGNLIGWHVAWAMWHRGTPLAGVVCIQPALRRDTKWPPDLPVLCLYNPHDWVVELGRAWGRFVSVAQPWRERHGWGAAGRHGFDDPGVTHWNVSEGALRAQGHSGVFEREVRAYWGIRVGGWCCERFWHYQAAQG